MTDLLGKINPHPSFEHSSSTTLEEVKKTCYIIDKFAFYGIYVNQSSILYSIELKMLQY